MRIRHLMILVVYAAVVFALLAPLRTPGPQHEILVISRVLIMPWVLMALSALILRPGPHRDWVVAFFSTAGFAILALVLTLPTLLFIVVLGRPWAKPIGGTWREPVKLGMELIYGLLIGIQITVAIRWYLIPSRCPHCGRRTLVSAAFQTGRRLTEKRHYHCGVCEREAVLDASQRNQGCPSCGRRTLFAKRYWFSWCLSCHSRYKRLRRGAWEAASSPAEDDFYWLWSLGGWFRALINRIAGMIRPIE